MDRQNQAAKGRDGLKVVCYSGHTYAERPRSFQWKGQTHEVQKIEKAWLEPGKKYFEVSCTDNRVFRLCYDEMEGQWSVVE